MQRGTCFINYEDFRECFTAYKNETRSSFSIQRSVSVRHHNSKFSTNIRPDIIFTEVKFSCANLQGQSGKRDSQDGACPAYFLLQYDMDLDRLVVKEECSTHNHTKETNPPQVSLVHSPETGECLSPDLEVPSKKICTESLSQSPMKENDQENVHLNVPSPGKPQSNLPLETQDIVDGHSKPTSAPVKESSSEELSIDVISRLDSFIKAFQKGHVGSKSSMTIGDQRQLEHLCFQTISMSSWFLKFPESLLLHRVPSKHGYILYTFLVETKERMCKIVHFSFVKEDNAKNVSKMLEMLKHFNFEWSKVKIIYTDIAFRQMDTLRAAFPSAQVLLSVYHTACLIKRKIKGSSDFKLRVNKWMEDAIFHTSSENVSFLAEKLEHKLDHDLYVKLCKDWFSNELLWYMHVKKGILSCGTYMDSIEMIDGTISNFLVKLNSMEIAVKEFLQSADSFNSKWLEKQKGGFPAFCSIASKGKPKNSSKKLRPIPPAHQTPSFASEVSTKSAREKAIGQPDKKAALNNGLAHGHKLGIWRSISLSNKMLLSLKEFCNDVGFQLCSKEWEVVQRSTHLINEQLYFTAVQILEDTHSVSLRGRSCTCYFNQDYRLPCRHILSVLYAYNKPVEENMVSLRWRKTYVKPLTDSGVYGKVTMFSNYTKSKDETVARLGMIKSLAKEFYNLLMQCDDPEMQVRISTLQMIVEMWQNDSRGKTPYPAQENRTQLPYRWVKIEPVEGDNSVCQELCRMDTKPPVI